MADIGNTSVFSQTDDSNTNTGTGPGFTGTMAPNAFDNNMRKLQGAITRDFNRRNPTLTSGGSANAYTLTHTVAPSGYYNGEQYTFKANHTNTGASTLNVNSLGATNIKYMVSGTATALPANVIISGAIVTVYYSTADTAFLLFAQSDMIGDSGSGGGRGLVPAPASGDGAASKALLADATWGLPSASFDYLGLLSGLAAATANFDSTIITKPYKMFILGVTALSHNSGTDQSFEVLISGNNGSTFSSAVTITNAITAASSASTFVLLPVTAGLTYFAVSSSVNATTGHGITSAGVTAPAGTYVNYIRLRPSAGSFDGGSARLWGLE